MPFLCYFIVLAIKSSKNTLKNIKNLNFKYLIFIINNTGCCFHHIWGISEDLFEQPAFIYKKSGIQIKSICFHNISHELKINITYHSYSSGNIVAVSFVWIDTESSLRWSLVSSSQISQKHYTSPRWCGSKWVRMSTLITCILTSCFFTLYLFFSKYTRNNLR